MGDRGRNIRGHVGSRPSRKPLARIISRGRMTRGPGNACTFRGVEESRRIRVDGQLFHDLSSETETPPPSRRCYTKRPRRKRLACVHARACVRELGSTSGSNQMRVNPDCFSALKGRPHLRGEAEHPGSKLVLRCFDWMS